MNLDEEKAQEFNDQVKEELTRLETKEETKEEVKEEVKEESKTEEVVEQPEQTDEEKEAISNGWKPDYKGPNKVSAYEFNRFGKMLKHQNELKSEITGLKDTVKQMVQHGRELEKAGYMKALREVDQKRRNAVELGDTLAFEEAEREVVDLHQKINQANEAEVQPEVKQEQQQPYTKTEIEVQFENRNKDWFNNESNPKSKEMTEEAYAHGMYLVQQVNAGTLQATPEQIIKKIEDRIRKVYPENFENQKKSLPPAVGKSTTSPSEGGKESVKLSERQLKLWKEAHRADPTFTKEEYAEQLKTIGAL